MTFLWHTIPAFITGAAQMLLMVTIGCLINCSNSLTCHYSLRVRQTYWSTPGVKSRRTWSRSTTLRSPVTWLKADQRAARRAQSPRADAASRPFLRRPPPRRSSPTRTTKDPQSCSGALLAPISRPLLCSCLLSSKPKALSFTALWHHRSTHTHTSVFPHSIVYIPVSQAQL